jgi:hypothetical protein
MRIRSYLKSLFGSADDPLTERFASGDDEKKLDHGMEDRGVLYPQASFNEDNLEEPSFHRSRRPDKVAKCSFMTICLKLGSCGYKPDIVNVNALEGGNEIDILNGVATAEKPKGSNWCTCFSKCNCCSKANDSQSANAQVSAPPRMSLS